MGFPRVTVVTPSYNQGAYLEETILSVLQQDYPDIEYIIMDGGSTDNSVDIIRRYADRLAYWVSAKDGGQANAINNGWRRATGEFITWLNSDDVLLPGALRHAAAALIADPAVDLVYGDMLLIDEHSTPFAQVHGREFSLERLLVQWDNPIPQQGFLMRRSLLEQVGWLDESFYFTMDFDYWVRLALAGKHVQHIPYRVGGFRYHADAKTSRAQERRLQDRQKIYDRVFHHNPPEALRGQVNASKAALYLTAAYTAYTIGDAAALRRYAGQHVAVAGLRSSPLVGAFWLASFLGDRDLVRLRRVWQRLHRPLHSAFKDVPPELTR